MWLIVDCNNWFAQCELSSPQSGYGCSNFIKRLRTVTGQVQHSRCFLCWDSPHSWRYDVSESYKSGRQVKRESYGSSLTECQRRAAELPGFTSLAVDGFEADDLVATLCGWAKGEGHKVVIFSADKDLHQLLEPGNITQVTRVQRLTQDRMAYTTVTAQVLRETTGVHPWQWIDYRTLTGDTSDNIRGCPGIGPKAAASLLQSVKALDKYYADPHARWKLSLTSRQIAALDGFRDQVAITRRLLTLVDSVPLTASLIMEAVG